MPDVKDCLPLAAAARHCGIARTTISSAVTRGELRHYMLGDGETRVVRVVDLDRWAATERKRGRPPKPRPKPPRRSP